MILGGTRPHPALERGVESGHGQEPTGPARSHVPGARWGPADPLDNALAARLPQPALIWMEQENK